MDLITLTDLGSEYHWYFCVFPHWIYLTIAAVLSSDPCRLSTLQHQIGPVPRVFLWFLLFYISDPWTTNQSSIYACTTPDIFFHQDYVVSQVNLLSIVNISPRCHLSGPQLFILGASFICSHHASICWANSLMNSLLFCLLWMDVLGV